MKKELNIQLLITEIIDGVASKEDLLLLANAYLDLEYKLESAERDFWDFREM